MWWRDIGLLLTFLSANQDPVVNFTDTKGGTSENLYFIAGCLSAIF